MKKHKKGLLSALIAALVLIVSVPVLSAFAGDDENAVSGADVVSGTEAYADEEYDHYAQIDFEIGYEDRAYYNETHKIIGFNNGDESISFTIPDCSNSANKFLYWRDHKLGKIYHPGDTCVIKVSELEIAEDEPYMYPPYDVYGWIINAVWQGDELAVNIDAKISFTVPDENPEEDTWWGDALNKYKPYWFGDAWWVQKSVTGTYSLKNRTFTFNEGNDSIQIPDDLIPTFKEYEFVEWNTKPDGTGFSYQPGDYVKLQSNGYSPDVNLYAIFEGYIKKNVLEVFAQEWRMGDEEGVAQYTQYLQYDDNGKIAEWTVPPALENKIGEFSHWYCYANEKSYYPGETLYDVDVNELSSTKTTDKEYSPHIYLEAVWKTDEIYIEREGGVSLMFESGSEWTSIPLKGTYNFKTEKFTFEGDPSYTIPTDRVPDNEKGYTFLGWNTSEYGTGTTYKPGDTIKFTDNMWVNLYALYETETEFVIEDTNKTNFVTAAEPMVGLTLINDVLFEEVTMVISEISDAAEEEKVLEALAEQVEISDTAEKNYSMVDISLIDSEGRSVDIEEGKIKIMISYPDIPNAKDYDYAIYHYVDGKAERIEVSKEADGLIFFAESFSPYALVWNEPKSGDSSTQPTTPDSTTSTDPATTTTTANGDSAQPDDNTNAGSPGTGDAFNPVIFAVLAVISAVSIIAVLVIGKKRKIA